MLIVDDVGDEDIADAGVERRRLADDVGPQQLPHVDGEPRQQVVGGETEGVIDVEDDRLAAGQGLQRQVAQPGVYRLAAQPFQLDELHLQIEGVLAGDAGDAVFGLPLRPRLQQIAPRLRLEILLQHVVEEVVAVAGRIAALDAAVLLLELRRGLVLQVVQQPILVRLGEAAEHIDQAVGVAGDEVERAFPQVEGGHLVDAVPPSLGGASVVDVGACEERNAHPLALPGHLQEEGRQPLLPDVVHPLPIIGGKVERLAHLLFHLDGDLAVGRPDLQHLQHPLLAGKEAVHLVPLDLEGGQRGNDVIHVGDAGDVGGEDAFPLVEEHAATAGRCDDAPPRLHLGVASAAEDLLALAQDDLLHLRDAGGQAEAGIGEGGHIRFDAARVGMERGAHRDVCLLQRADLHLARRAQQRVDGAHVERNRIIRWTGNASLHLHRAPIPRPAWRPPSPPP